MTARGEDLSPAAFAKMRELLAAAEGRAEKAEKALEEIVRIENVRIERVENRTNLLDAALANALAHVEALKVAGEGLVIAVMQFEDREAAWARIAAWRKAVDASAAEDEMIAGLKKKDVLRPLPKPGG